MKKVIQILAAVALVVVIVWGVKSIFTKSNGIGDNLNSSESPQFEAVKTNYLPVAPFSGPDFTTAAEKTIHGVVHIRSEFTGRTGGYDDFFSEFFGYSPNMNRTYSGFGSGVIISNDGYIVTNNHVVEDANLINVTLNDNSEYEATLIGTDPTTDLALLKIDGENIPFISFGNSDLVLIGEWVLAVGNPFNLTSTVTAGIVSAKARNINILGTPGAIESFIQTDAAVNMGNSGGALVNMNGELVGVNAAIASNTGSYAGYSFAIPVNIVKKVVDDLLNYGLVQRAYLGVTIREVDSKLVKDKGLDVINGVYVESVTESGGAKESGIEAGDVIVSVDNHLVRTNAELLEVIGQNNPGNIVEVIVNRDGVEKNYRVELRNQLGSTAVEKKGDDFFMSDLGATLEQVPDEDMKNLNITGGLKVVDLEDGMLKKGGVQKGFIILKINGLKISGKQDVDNALRSIKNGVIRIEGVYPNGMKMNYGFIL
ncbi:MAG: PDZ domain-containing protein [Bacteroidales bacterium]|nr:PDZ domain-containing protein [Bacteroidales bacterium]